MVNLRQKPQVMVTPCLRLLMFFHTIAFPLFSFLFDPISPSRADSSHLVVNITSGSFRGVLTSNDTDRWLGIPFAQPPVGNLRFKAPVPVTQAPSDIRNASAFGNACPQLPSSSLGVSMSEDCLYLNVWRQHGTTSEDKLPVLVWIYVGIAWYTHFP